MSEPEQEAPRETETATPSPESETRLRRGLRYSHRTGLYISLVIAIATIVFLILLIARNTRHVKVDYVVGNTQARPGLARHHQCDHGLGARDRDGLPHPPPHALAWSPVTEAMYALNFYSPIVAEQLRSGRKTATIRLGDKSAKYRKGMIVQVLAGMRFSPRERVFAAVIDKVEVKALSELSPREIEHDNPEIRRTEDMASFLSQLYNREVTPDDTVTVIRFSQIKG